MPANKEVKAIIDVLVEASIPHANALAVAALGKLVEANKDDPFKALALQIAKDLVEAEGVEILESYGEELGKLLDGKKAKIEGLTAKQLTQLANEMQSLEAHDLRKTKKWAQTLGKSAKRLVAILPQVLRGFIL